jgi:uncharacterized protein YqjF (DUF2071 family)
VPAELEVDTYEGSAYVGLVAFVMESLRMRGAPKALSLSFLEINVRTYVHVAGTDPGVYFFSLDANSRFAVISARLSFGLPYKNGRMTLSHNGEDVVYTAERNGPRGRRPFFEACYQPSGGFLGPASPGTLDHFLLERYILHVPRFARIWTARIHHRPYERQNAYLKRCNEDLVVAAGVVRPNVAPIVHYVRAVDVELFALRSRHLGT